MMKVLSLVFVLTLSSCGLFNKAVTKRQLDSSVSAKVDVSRKSNENAKVSAVDISEGAKVTSTPGKTGTATGSMKNGVGIITDSTGLLLVALIDSLSGNLTIAYNLPGGYHADYWRNSSGKDSSGNSSSALDSASALRQDASSRSVDKERKPSFVGTAAMWLGLSLLAIAVVWAIAKFVLKR